MQKYFYSVQYGDNGSSQSFNTKAEAMAFMFACFDTYPEKTVRVTRFRRPS